MGFGFEDKGNDIELNDDYTLDDEFEKELNDTYNEAIKDIETYTPPKEPEEYEDVSSFSDEGKELADTGFETYEDVVGSSDDDEENDDSADDSSDGEPTDDSNDEPNGKGSEDMAKGKKGSKGKKHNKVRIFLNSLLSVVLIISVLLTGFMGTYIANADSDITKIPLFKYLFGSSLKTEDETKGEEKGKFEPLKLSDNADVTYFLVVGCDWTDTKQTDVIVVVCMDHKNNKVSMLQIPRDTYTEYNNVGKINAVYNSAKKGEAKINALRRCLSKQLGIPIDHYILFTIEGSVKVVDALGGIRMNLPNAIRIEDPLHFGKYYNIGPGKKVKLSGRDAIGFARKRDGDASEDENYDGSDIGRVKQQRKFYSALFTKLLKTSYLDLYRIGKSCFSQVQTDMSLNEAIAYANAAKKLKKKRIHIFGLPGQACSYNGISYYSIHKDDYVKVWNKYFNHSDRKLRQKNVKMTELYVLAGQAKNDYWLTADDSTLKDY